MSTHNTWSNNWMSGIKPGTKICEISIPGTHDSCARYGGPAYECQWFSITQQLNRGIRFLDIRCRYRTDGDSGRTQGIYFPIHHEGEYQKILFEEVQAQCIAFLAENPSEFILMNVQMEYDCANNKGGCSDQFRNKFLELTAPYQRAYWYMKDSIPTIDECRGRIVLVRAHDPVAKKGWASGIDRKDPSTFNIWPDGEHGGGLAWNGFNIDGTSENTIFKTQNGWKRWSGTDKGDEVEAFIRDARAQSTGTPPRITLNFASYARDGGPGPNAEGMNPRIQNFLREYRDNGNWGVTLGVIPIDFTGNTGDGGQSLENLIIEHQAHQAPAWSYAGIPDWLKKASA